MHNTSDRQYKNKFLVFSRVKKFIWIFQFHFNEIKILNKKKVQLRFPYHK
jgi:hypothetical protein